MSTITIVKLVLTPLLIAAATLAARRWGQRVGGLVTGLPLTSGPVSVFLAIGGPPEAHRFLQGVAFGMFSAAAFFIVAAAGLERLGPPLTYALATAAALSANVLALAVLVRGGSR